MMYYGVIVADLSNPSLWQPITVPLQSGPEKPLRQLREKYIILEVKKSTAEHLWDFFLCGYLAQNL